MHPQDPPHSAWGLYGRQDELGTLNRLTDEMVANAARDEIKTGERYLLACCRRLRSNLVDDGHI